MTNPQPMTNDEILAVVQAEQSLAESWGDELSSERETAMDYYYGRPMGDEQEGCSQVVSMDVAEVIEWMMPSLYRMFCGDDELIEFVPAVNDVKGADVATKYVRHVVFQENEGERLIHDVIKDGLLSKVGAFKWGWVEKREPVDRQYRGLSELELVQLIEGLQQPDVEVQIIGQEAVESADGVTYNVVVRMIRKYGKVEIDAIPPEELLISRSAKAVDDTCRYIGHRTVKSRSELVQMGLPIDLVMDLPTYSGHWYTEEYSSRYQGITPGIDTPAQNEMAQPVEYVEHYVLIDVDGDGITERRVICTSGNRILRNEVISMLPIAAWSPVRMPHAVVGRSIADMVMDIQRIMTALMRGTLDNIYNVNAGGRLFVQGDVNIDDLLTVQPGGIVRGKAGSAIKPLGNEYTGDRSMQVMGMVREVRDQRSGVVKHSQGLNSIDLHESATVGGKMMDQAIERVELVGRMFATLALKRLWSGILDTVIQYQDTKKQTRVGGGVLEVDPLGFREKYGMRVKVGIGAAKKAERVRELMAISANVEKMLMTGSPLVTPSNDYNAKADVMQAMGYDPSRYMVDPNSPQGKQMAQQRAIAAEKAKRSEVDPYVEAEIVKSKARMAEAAQKDQFDRADRMVDHAEWATETTLKYGVPVPGSML